MTCAAAKHLPRSLFVSAQIDARVRAEIAVGSVRKSQVDASIQLADVAPIDRAGGVQAGLLREQN